MCGLYAVTCPVSGGTWYIAAHGPADATERLCERVGVEHVAQSGTSYRAGVRVSVVIPPGWMSVA